MRKLLFTLLLLPFFAQAQLEFGLNAGIVPYKVGIRLTGETLELGHGYSASFGYKIHKVKLGLGYDAAILPVKQQYTNGLMPLGSATLYYARPLSNMYVFADRELQFGRSCFYIGVYAGLVLLQHSNYADYGDASTTATGIDLGAHIGYTYDFYKGLCANVQAAITDPRLNLGMLTFPITVGLHYKLPVYKRTAPVAATK